MNFFLGTHETAWLAQTDVPLFVSHRRLMRRKRWPRALGRWAMDSGGFTELSMFGAWQTTETQYIESVYRAVEDIGNLKWAAPMDWMCEPFMLEKTGGTVASHQEKTVENYVRLREAAPELPFIPVLQGWTLADYDRCCDLYEKAGVDLATVPTVGVGSVCRRQGTGTVDLILSTLAARGLQLHGFGVKTLGLTRYARALKSADSLAWSYRARNAPPLAGCSHGTCSSCLRFALAWRTRVLRRLDHEQLRFAA